MLQKLKHILILIRRYHIYKFKLWFMRRAYKKKHNVLYYVSRTQELKLALNAAAMLACRLTKTCPVRYDSKDIDFIAAGDAHDRCRNTECKQPELCWYNYFICCGCYAKIDEEVENAETN